MRLTSYKSYQLFKYAIYALLTFNIYLFFSEEWAATAHRFAAGMQVTDWIEAFAATIDTGAWVVLLLMFELETWVLDDRRITGRVKLALHTLRILCFAVIVYAFYGYLTKLLFLYSAQPLPGVADLCTLVGEARSYAIGLDEYEPLTPTNCALLSPSTEFWQWEGLAVAVDLTGLRNMLRLAWLDVINAGVWLLVVAVLEIDVRLQKRGGLTTRMRMLSTASKYLFYSILLLAAIYWGFKGNFIDFWDAFLWLVAFVFIEMNVFEWRRESANPAS